jgi:molecular chaperone GrpE
VTTDNPPADDGAEPTDAADAKGADSASAPASPVDEPPDKPGDAEPKGDVATQLAERTADLQRITAEYHNYRKRVERDRQLASEQVTGAVLAGLLPVLDDIDRAREHGDLEGPFATVAEQLINSLVKLGLEVFGEKGDVFDPMVHEAVAHMHSADVTEPSCIDVMRRGYRIGERLLRPAMVAVAEPADVEVEPEPEPAVVESEVVAEEEETVEATDAEESPDDAESPKDEAEDKDAKETDEAEADDEADDKPEATADADASVESDKAVKADEPKESEADEPEKAESDKGKDKKKDGKAAEAPKPKRKPSPRPRPREDAAGDDK